MLVPRLGIRAPVWQGEHRERRDPGAQPRVRGGAQMFPIAAPAVSHRDPRGSGDQKPSAHTPLGLSFQGASLSLAAHHPSNPFSGESAYGPGFRRLAQSFLSPRHEPLPPPAATWPGRSLCMHTSRGGDLTTSERQDHPWLVPRVLALYSRSAPVLRQGIESPPKGPLPVTWETDSTGHGRAAHQSGPPPAASCTGRCGGERGGGGSGGHAFRGAPCPRAQPYSLA